MLSAQEEGSEFLEVVSFTIFHCFLGFVFTARCAVRQGRTRRNGSAIAAMITVDNRSMNGYLLVLSISIFSKLFFAFAHGMRQTQGVLIGREVNRHAVCQNASHSQRITYCLLLCQNLQYENFRQMAFAIRYLNTSTNLN